MTGNKDLERRDEENLHTFEKCVESSGISLSFSQKEALQKYAHALANGSALSIVMNCKGTSCPVINTCPLALCNIKLPVGEKCQPPGTLVLVRDKTLHAKHPDRFKDVMIQDLNPNIHAIISYASKLTPDKNGGKSTLKTRGRNFTLHSREYTGDLIVLKAGNHISEYTKEHKCLVRWNDNAREKFVVYLMRRGNYFRIGKSQILSKSKNGDKSYSRISNRVRAERADALWILGAYNTNSEALLAEEYFSIKFSTPKSLFIATRNRIKTKYDGLYAWINQETLDKHHQNCSLSLDHYRKCLDSIGLSLEHPLYDTNIKHQMGGSNCTFETSACNIISEIMDVPIISLNTYPYPIEFCPVSKEVRKYNGKVYSLDVEKEHTYIGDGIITHNCPVELFQMNRLIATHCAALDIDPSTPMGALEMLQVLEIARAEILEYRASAALADNPNLVRTSLISVEMDGTKIFEDKIVPEVELLERWFRIKTKLRTELLATRQAQASAGKSYADKSKEAAELAAKVDEINRLKAYRESMPIKNKDEIIVNELPKHKP